MGEKRNCEIRIERFHAKGANRERDKKGEDSDTGGRVLSDCKCVNVCNSEISCAGAERA